MISSPRKLKVYPARENEWSNAKLQFVETPHLVGLKCIWDKRGKKKQNVSQGHGVSGTLRKDCCK